MLEMPDQVRVSNGDGVSSDDWRSNGVCLEHM